MDGGWKNGAVSALLEKRLLFVTGKGGVGKSTVALALGIAAAAQGRRTIVCELSAQEHASRTFRRAEIGFHEVELRNDLWAISIDPDRSMREYILLQTRIRAMGDLLYRSRIFNYLAAATPGLREMVTIGKIWELAQLDRKVKRGRSYDLVIVDAPATGHGIGFLQTPKTFAEIANSFTCLKMLRLRSIRMSSWLIAAMRFCGLVSSIRPAVFTVALTVLPEPIAPPPNRVQVPAARSSL